MSYLDFRWGKFSICTNFIRSIKQWNISLLHILLLKRKSIHCNVIYICKVKRASGGQGYIGKYIVLVLVSALKPIGVWCMIRVHYLVLCKVQWLGQCSSVIPVLYMYVVPLSYSCVYRIHSILALYVHFVGWENARGHWQTYMMIRPKQVVSLFLSLSIPGLFWVLYVIFLCEPLGFPFIDHFRCFHGIEPYFCYNLIKNDKAYENQ